MAKKKPEDYAAKFTEPGKPEPKKPEPEEPQRTCYFKLPESTYKKFQHYIIDSGLQKSEFANQAFLLYMDKK